jgi:hypothetical protein
MHKINSRANALLAMKQGPPWYHDERVNGTDWMRVLERWNLFVGNKVPSDKNSPAPAKGVTPMYLTFVQSSGGESYLTSLRSTDRPRVWLPA